MENKIYLEELSDKIWATKNSRFTAYRRMKRCNISSFVATAMSSANIIAVNMLCYIKTDVHIKYLNENAAVVSIILSVMALALSLIVSLLKYSDRSNSYHKCGIELDSLNQEIKVKIKEAKIQNSFKELSKEVNEYYLKRYEDILRSSNLDHSRFDYEYSSYEQKKRNKENISFAEYVTMWLRWNIFDVNFLYWVIAIAPLFLIVLFTCKVLL